MNPSTGKDFRQAFWFRRAFLCALILLAGTFTRAFAQLDFVGARRDLGVGSSPRSIAYGDLNGDSKPDMVVAASSSNVVSVLLGMGGGVFRPATSVGTSLDPEAVVLGNFDSDAFLDMAVACYLQDRVEIFMGNGAGGFGAPTSILTGGLSRPIALAALDWFPAGDGRNESLVVVLNGLNQVRLYEGNGLGGFTLNSSTLTVPLSPVAVAAGDLDGDGYPDVAVVSEGDTSLNPPPNGSVTVAYHGFCGVPLAPHLCNSMTKSVYQFPESVSIGLLNNDNLGDLLVGSIYVQNMAVLYGDAILGYGNANPLNVGGLSHASAVGDFNGDGLGDIAVAIEAGASSLPTVRIYTGNGVGIYTQAGTFPVASTPGSVVAFDFGGSTALDLATANTQANSVSLLFGNGTGGFTATPNYALPAVARPNGLVSADMNGNGTIDLAVSRIDANQVDLIQGTGTGTFNSWQSLTLPNAGSAGDAEASTVLFDRFTSDANADLAVLDSGLDKVSVFPGNGAGTFGARVDYSLGTSCNPNDSSPPNGCTDPLGMAAGPLNDTDATHPDLVVTLRGGEGSFPYGSVAVLLQSGAGFGAATRYAGGSSPVCDGGPSPGIPCTSNTQCQGECSGNAAACTYDSSCPSGQSCIGAGFCSIGPTGVAVGLVNGDTNRDLISCDSGNITAAYLPGAGTGAFSTVGSSVTPGLEPRWPLLKDLDGDGDLDLATVNSFAGSVSTFLGNNAGVFTPLVETGCGPSPTAGILADLNLDGWDDLAVNNTTSGSLSVLLGDGTGHFGAPVRLGVGLRPTSISVADYNGDGSPDLACPNQMDGTISILLNASHVPQLSLNQAGSATSLTWTPMFEASSYDIIRGELSLMTEGATSINLGAVTCVENDSPDLASSEVGVTPPVDGVYFYLMRNQDPNVKGSYGSSSLNKIRLPASGNCL